MISVVVADDEELVREGLAAIVDSHADFEVVGTAADGDHAIAAVAEHEPDVALMDVRMPAGHLARAPTASRRRDGSPRPAPAPGCSS